jgi:hypothetical protein
MDRKCLLDLQVASDCLRFAKPLNWETGFGGSNPLSALGATGSDRTRQEPSFPRVIASSTPEHSTPPARQEPTDNETIRPLRATECATGLLPSDPDLALVNEAWPKLPDAVKSTILMLVKVSRAE